MCIRHYGIRERNIRIVFRYYAFRDLLRYRVSCQKFYSIARNCSSVHVFEFEGANMTHSNKLNQQQKNILGEFMKEHPSLAKNILPNCAQGKATAIRLWENLSKQLNVARPPVKDAKTWRKVFADQKYQAKKKLCFNKASKRQTGGGPYTEKLITEAEENIIEASGLEVTVEGLSTVSTFGRSSTLPSVEFNSSDTFEMLEEEVVDLPSDDLDEENVCPIPKNVSTKKNCNANERFVLLENNLKVANESKAQMGAKLDRLIEIQERLLQIKEQKYKDFAAIRKMDFEIKQTELKIKRKKLEMLEGSLN